MTAIEKSTPLEHFIQETVDEFREQFTYDKDGMFLNLACEPFQTFDIESFLQAKLREAIEFGKMPASSLREISWQQYMAALQDVREKMPGNYKEEWMSDSRPHTTGMMEMWNAYRNNVLAILKSLEEEQKN